MKRCPRCGEIKPQSEFGTRRRPSGNVCPLSYCKPCHVEYHKAWRATPRGSVLFTLASNASRARYPEREAARRRANEALHAGRLNRGPCVIGGDCSPGVTEAHHDDYSKPLEVRWVCRKHHRILDRARAA